MAFTDPGFDIQRAIVRVLLADAAVKSIVSAPGVYDRVPRNKDGNASASFPYVTIGETQTIPELGEGTDAAETFLTLHTWSRAAGAPEVKSLSAAVIAALHDQSIALASGAIQSLLLQDHRILPDPDGLTSHGVLAFQILTDAN